MIRHLLKLVWHRKRTNALVMAEIFLSFLIVFAVVTLAVSLWSRWHSPLGFEWKNVWMVEINTVLPMERSASRTDGNVPPAEFEQAAVTAAGAERILRELKSLPEIESAAADAMSPYSENTWTTSFNVDGKGVNVNADHATDDFARVMRIQPIKGRWFSAEDDGQNYLPIVLDADAAREMYGDKDPIGRMFSADHFTAAGIGPQQFRVVGLIPPFRKDGELSDRNMKMVFFRLSFLRPDPPDTSRIVLRLRPGTPAAFEAQLNDRLRRLGGISFTIKRMDAMRRSALKMRFVPLAMLSIIALFLITMVALGLTGVLWQTITRRMREIGLRRAVGASGHSVRSQVLGEVALLSTLSVIAGAIVILQLPLLGAFGVVTPAEFSSGFAAALVVIYGITTLCGAYPSWLASTIEPADALRYE